MKKGLTKKVAAVAAGVVIVVGAFTAGFTTVSNFSIRRR